MIPDPAPPFEVDASGRIRERMRRILQPAADLGVEAEIRQTLTSILQHLTLDPRGWGDPLWRFRAAQLTQYGAHLRGFRCEHAVHDRIPTVVITSLVPLPGNPLYGENFDG